MCAVCDQEAIPDPDRSCDCHGQSVRGGYAVVCDSCGDSLGWGEVALCNAEDDDHDAATAKFVDPESGEACATMAEWALIDGCAYCPRCTAGSAERCDYCLDWYWNRDLRGVFVGDWLALCPVDLEEFWREDPAGPEDLPAA